MKRRTHSMANHAADRALRDLPPHLLRGVESKFTWSAWRTWLQPARVWRVLVLLLGWCVVLFMCKNMVERSLTPGFTFTHSDSGWVVHTQWDGDAPAPGTRLTHIRLPAQWMQQWFTRHAHNPYLQQERAALLSEETEVRLDRVGHVHVPLHPQWLRGSLDAMMQTSDRRVSLVGELLLHDLAQDSAVWQHAYWVAVTDDGVTERVYPLRLRALQWSEAETRVWSMCAAALVLWALAWAMLVYGRLNWVTVCGVVLIALFLSVCWHAPFAWSRQWAQSPQWLWQSSANYSLGIRWSVACCFLLIGMGLQSHFKRQEKTIGDSKQSFYNLLVWLGTVVVVGVFVWMWTYEYSARGLIGINTYLWSYILMYASVLIGCFVLFEGQKQFNRRQRVYGDGQYVLHSVILRRVSVGLLCALVLSILQRSWQAIGVAATSTWLSQEVVFFWCLVCMCAFVTAVVLAPHVYRVQTRWWSTQIVLSMLGATMLVLTCWYALDRAGLQKYHVLWLFCIAALVYVAIRMMLLVQAQQQEERTLSQSTHKLLTMASQQAKPEDVQAFMTYTLVQQFAPLDVRVEHATESFQQRMERHQEGVVRIGAGGGELWVDGFFHTLCLTGADHGNRLFTVRDVEIAYAIWGLALQSTTMLSAFQGGEAAERKRIAADLHDTLGGRLLHLTASNDKKGQLALEILEDLRVLTRMMSGETTVLADVLADMRFATTTRCEAAGIEVDFEVNLGGSSAIHQTELLDASLVTAWLMIHLELLRNAMQHDGVRHIVCVLDVVGDAVTYSIRNDGAPTDVSSWKQGFGVPAVQMRARQHQGTAAWHSLPTGGVRCEVSWPVQVWQSASHAFDV